jgi:integrase/recombinase XerC/integrase/recombinase XerD
MKIEEIISQYLSYIKRQHSSGTYRFYKSHLSHFVNWCNLNLISTVSEFDEEAINEYICQMKLSCENVTINKRVGILKRMYKRLNIDFTYLYSIEKLKERSKTFDMLSREELKSINRYVNSLPDEAYNNLMYKGVITLLTDTGCRINELINIEKKNITIESDYGYILLTVTKMKKDRLVPFTAHSIPIIKKLIEDNKKSTYLFYNKLKDRNMTYDDVIFFMRKLKDKLNIDKLHPHMFRHSMATIWLENGADLKSVMLVLGHQNMKTTDRYLHNSIAHIRKTYINKFKIQF